MDIFPKCALLKTQHIGGAFSLFISAYFLNWILESLFSFVSLYFIQVVPLCDLILFFQFSYLAFQLWWKLIFGFEGISSPFLSSIFHHSSSSLKGSHRSLKFRLSSTLWVFEGTSHLFLSSSFHLSFFFFFSFFMNETLTFTEVALSGFQPSGSLFFFFELFFHNYLLFHTLMSLPVGFSLLDSHVSLTWISPSKCE